MHSILELFLYAGVGFYRYVSNNITWELIFCVPALLSSKMSPVSREYEKGRLLQAVPETIYTWCAIKSDGTNEIFSGVN